MRVMVITMMTMMKMIVLREHHKRNDISIPFLVDIDSILVLVLLYSRPINFSCC